MTHGSLFSGIGGFDLAAEWMGWENKFHCEWNEFGQKVLKYYWPNATRYGDITKTDFSIWRGKIDVLSGGFPCQPYSLAGKRKGKEDERHLWPEMLRAIREIQPSWVVGENVFGLVNWSGGLVFHEVQTDLEAEGYEVFPYVLPACGKNAPHRRDRVWFVAHRKNDGLQRPKVINGRKEFKPHNRHTVWDRIKSDGESGTSPNSHSIRLNRGECEHEINTGEGRFNAQRNSFKGLDDGDAADTKRIGSSGKEHGFKESRFIAKAFEGCGFENFPTQSPVCTGNDGVPSQLDGITFSKWRNESIKAAGNAIVPQVVYEIFKVIEEYGSKDEESYPVT